MDRVLMSSECMEWRTPERLFRQLDDEFHFNLDPASSEDNAKCENYYTEKENGLEKSWGGTGFS